jgi:hypothetical protein
MSADTANFVLKILPMIFIVMGVIPIVRASHHSRINLSVWAVVAANAWLAGLGNFFYSGWDGTAVYLLGNAVILSPVLFSNLGKGVWGDLPAWHRAAAFLLPVGTLGGTLMGGEITTWTSIAVSSLLCAQLAESCWKRLSRENISTWSWFLLADGTSLALGWGSATLAVKVLLAIWVFQCLMVIALELFNRKFGGAGMRWLAPRSRARLIAK